MMNDLIQNIMIIAALITAVGFLFKKFFGIPLRKKSSKACGQDNCGCS